MTVGNLTILLNQNNYGQRLQTYALQTYIKNKFSAICFTFDFRIKENLDNDKFFHKFERECLNLKQANKDTLNECDKIIIGGDQVLNYGYPTRFENFITGGLDLKYIVFFYGAGIPPSHRVDEKMVQRFRPYVIQYGTREDCLNIEYQKVLDPIFLLGVEEWKSIAKKPTGPYGGTVKYIVHGSVSSFSIEKNEIKTNLLVNIKQNQVPDPREFLWYFLNASKVITNSYHGFAFSLLFKVPEIKLQNKSDHRIKNLISMLDVKFEDDTVVNYDEIEKNISKWLDTSNLFIKNCMESTTHVGTKEIHAQTTEFKNKDSSEKRTPVIITVDLNEVETISINRKKETTPTSSTFNQCKYAVYSKDNFVRNRSSSGGFCAEIARKFFMNNGIVYGGAYSNDFRRVETIAVSSMNEYLEKLSGSKYSFCHLPNIQLIKNEMLSEKPVLFIGSPCQIGAVKKFMNSEIPENCILCDLRCRGYSKQEKLQKLIDNAESNGRRVININFRPNHESGKVILFFNDWGNIQSTYSREFIFDSMDMCRSCKFDHGNKSEADITVGDFWENMRDRKHLGKEFMPENGCNIIFIRSVKGLNLFNSIKEQLEFRELN